MLVFALVISIVATAQTPQTSNPTPQATPQSPAANSANTTAPQTQPAPSASSHRFVTSENFYRPGAKPSPSASAPSAATPSTPAQPAPRPAPATPVAQPALIARPNAVGAPRAIVPQPVPVNAPTPEIHYAQPAVAPAVMAAPNPASGAPANAAIDYAAGQLSVVADNAPLGFVLKLIAAKTGAVIDLAPELQNEPVVAHVGPNSVRDVLTALLDSPKIDYIVLGGSDENDRLQRVVVRMRHSSGSFATSVRRQPQPRSVETSGDEEKLDPDGHLISSTPVTSDPQGSAKQRMENWQRTREAMRLAEIKQQAQERENEKNGSPDPPAPPQDNQPPDPPQNPPQENPPSN